LKRYEAVIFDLDGTLLNTIDDLADSLNATLLKWGLPVLSVSGVRDRVGNGLHKLVERSVPEGTDIEPIFKAFKAYYFDHYNIKTAPYPQVIPVLDALKKAGRPMGIVSNKAQPAVTALYEAYFSSYVDVAFGERENVPRKPAPDSVFSALAQLNVPVTQAVYVGDSEVDFQTAKNAGMDCILVSWGFRDKSVLEGLEGAVIVDTGEALMAALNG